MEGRKGGSVAIVVDVPWYCLPSSTGAVTGQFFRLWSVCSSVRGKSPQGQLNYHLTKPRSASVERCQEALMVMCDMVSLIFLSISFYLLQSVKENRPLPSSPDAWASYKETNSKRTVIKSLITDFEKRRSHESKPKAS